MQEDIQKKEPDGRPLLAEYTPQCPSTISRELEEHTGYPRPQANYQCLPTSYWGPHSAYPGPQSGHAGPPPGCAVGVPVQNGPSVVVVVSPWMPAPPPLLNCPPGLQYLTQIDQILIHQQVEPVRGMVTNTKFEVKNSTGQRIYFAVEDTDSCTRNCYGAYRPFTLKMLDNVGREVTTLQRSLKCESCCYLEELEVQAPPGVPVGYAVQTRHSCLPKLTLQNEKREDVLKIIGPCVTCRCCSDIDFEITSLDEESRVGKISKYWSGFAKEACTDADNFGVQFPLDLDVKMKAVMLGTCFLIDFMFFEEC